MTVIDSDLELFLNFVPPERRADWRQADSIHRLAVSFDHELPLLRHWFAEDDDALKAHLERIAPAYAALPDLQPGHADAMSWEAHTFLKKIDWISEDDPSNGVKLCAILLALQTRDAAFAAALRERLFRFVQAPSLSARVQLALLAHVNRRLGGQYANLRNVTGLDAALLARFLGLAADDPQFVLRILKKLPSAPPAPVWPFEGADAAQVLELARSLMPHDAEIGKGLLAGLLDWHRSLRDADGGKLDGAAAAALRQSAARELAAARKRSPASDPAANDKVDWLLLAQGDAKAPYWSDALEACTRYITGGNDQSDHGRGTRRAELAFYTPPDSMELADALVEFEMWASELPDYSSAAFEATCKAVAARFRAVQIATSSERQAYNSAFPVDYEHPIVQICDKVMAAWVESQRAGGAAHYLPLLAMCTCSIRNPPVAAAWDEKLAAAFAEHAPDNVAEAGRALGIVANNARWAGNHPKERTATLMLLLDRLLPLLHAISPEEAARAIHERDRDMAESGEWLYS